MIVVDEAAWQTMRQGYIRQGGEEGQSIVELAENWATETENFFSENPDLGFREALDVALVKADIEKASSGMFAEVLVILSQVWEWADRMLADLTYIELRILETAFSEKITALSESAGS